MLFQSHINRCAKVNHHHTSHQLFWYHSALPTQTSQNNSSISFPNGKLLDTCCFAVLQRLANISPGNDFATLAAVQFNMVTSFRLFLCGVKISGVWQIPYAIWLFTFVLLLAQVVEGSPSCQGEYVLPGFFPSYYPLIRNKKHPWKKVLNAKILWVDFIVLTCR